jgi:type IV pilus assembly protein PilM
MKSRKVIFSIPDYSTFFIEFELPPMTPEEIPEAIKYEAKRYIPLPLKDITLDWQILGKKSQGKRLIIAKVLLVSVPNEIIKQYKNIASILNLELIALEAEAFGLLRALIPKEETLPVSIVDIGQKSTICSIIDKGVLKASHSFDISADDLIEKLLENFDIDYQTAKEFLKRYGILARYLGPEGQEAEKILIPIIESLAKEIDNVFEKFYSEEKKEIGKIILSGAPAIMPGLLTYFENYFKKKVEIANPFSKISYPSILEKVLKEIGPSYAVAVGMALKGFE